MSAPLRAAEALTPIPIARPPTPSAVAAELAACRARGHKVMPLGRGTRRGPGAASAPVDRIVSTALLGKIVEHEPGDQTITVQAGVTLADLDAHLARSGQWLPVQQSAGTVGGLLATGADGALDLGYGRLRDRLLGCTLALANGALVGGRGRVVKNVAGYDLPRLMLGSLGTLGLVVEASFRVQPRPQAHTSMVFRFASPEPAFAAAAALLDSGLEPVFCNVLLSANLPVAGPQLSTRLAFGFDGARTVVPNLVAESDELVSPHRPGALELGAGEHDEEFRASLDEPVSDPPGATRARVSAPRAEIPALATRLCLAAHRAGLAVQVDARPGLGLLFISLHPLREAEVRAVLAHARAAGPTVLLEAPAALSSPDDVWGAPPADFAVMQAIKRSLDADSVLVAGRFVGGL